MTETHSAPVVLAIPSRDRPTPPGRWAATIAFAWRSFTKIRRAPELLGDVIAIPIVFTLIFTFLFGGAIDGSPHRYAQYMLPGSTAMAVLLVTMYSGTNLNADIANGAFDRFRSLPIWRPAPIVGSLLGDAARYLLAAILVVVLGLAIGFRPAGGIVGVTAGIALAIAFALSLSLIWIVLGLLVRTPIALTGVATAVLFPLTLASNIFVPPATMPAWLRTFVDVNPVSHLVTAERSLMAGTPAVAPTVYVIAASGILVMIFGPTAARLYGRAG